MLFAQPEGLPWDDLRKILREGQRMAVVPIGIEIWPNLSEHWPQASTYITCYDTAYVD